MTQQEIDRATHLTDGVRCMACRRTPYGIRPNPSLWMPGDFNPADIMNAPGAPDPPTDRGVHLDCPYCGAPIGFPLIEAHLRQREKEKA